MRLIPLFLCFFFTTTILALDEDRLVKLGFPKSGTKRQRLSSIIAKKLLKHLPNSMYDYYITEAPAKIFEPHGNCDNSSDINEYFMNVYSNDSDILDEKSFEKMVKFQIQRGKRGDQIENKASFYKCNHDNKVGFF